MAKYSRRRIKSERENISKPHITRDNFGHWHYIWMNGFCPRAGYFCHNRNNAAPKRGLKA